MPSFGLFRKPKKQEEPENTAISAQEPEKDDVSQNDLTEENSSNSSTETTIQSSEPSIAPEPEATAPAPVNNKTYLKAMPLKELADIEGIKNEVQKGNILILRITPLATKSIEDVKSAVNDLYAFTESIGGDIARLGEERVVICPKNIRIWREKTPVTTESLPTAA